VPSDQKKKKGKKKKIENTWAWPDFEIQSKGREREKLAPLVAAGGRNEEKKRGFRGPRVLTAFGCSPRQKKGEKKEKDELPRPNA